MPPSLNGCSGPVSGPLFTAPMVTQAKIIAVLDDELRDVGDATMVRIDLDAIPGAVWQTELQSALPPDVRVSLFERGAQKCALLSFASGQFESAHAAFVSALQAANEVSQQAHAAVVQAREKRREG